MPIPPFTIDGVLPPYIGSSGPGGLLADQSPYVVSAIEVAATLGQMPQRNAILRGWLQHRGELRRLGFSKGFQWLDGSFVEQKDPRDLDVVTFLYRPPITPAALSVLLQSHANLFDRTQAKATYLVDLFLIDLNGSPEGMLNAARYYANLFSHRRNDELWKGMLQVRMESIADDATALAVVGT